MLAATYQSTGYVPAIVSTTVIIALFVVAVFCLIKDHYFKDIVINELNELRLVFSETDTCSDVPKLYADAIQDIRSYRIDFESIGCNGIQQFYQLAHGAMERFVLTQIESLTNEYQERLSQLSESSHGAERNKLSEEYTAKVAALEEPLKAFKVVAPPRLVAMAF